MMSEIQHGFFRHGDNTYLANFSESEREVLTNLAEQIIELLAERFDHPNDDPLAAMVGITMHDTPPDDEVLLRLLPNAYADQVDASEFRRYTESTLRQKKQAHAMAMRMHTKSAIDGVIELDVVAWVVIRHHHEPRDTTEEANFLPYHYEGFEIAPRGFEVFDKPRRVSEPHG